MSHILLQGTPTTEHLIVSQGKQNLYVDSKWKHSDSVIVLHLMVFIGTTWGFFIILSSLKHFLLHSTSPSRGRQNNIIYPGAIGSFSYHLNEHTLKPRFFHMHSDCLTHLTGCPTKGTSNGALELQFWSLGKN